MTKPQAFLFMWLVGAPLYMPAILNWMGIFKSWYLARLIPGFSGGRLIVHFWPLSLMFVCFPIVALLPISEEVAMRILSGTVIAGFIITPVLMVWNPRWLKPHWQRRLESQYDRNEIVGVFIPAWRQMRRREWGQLIETEEGLRELVRRARASSDKKSPSDSSSN